MLVGDVIIVAHDAVVAKVLRTEELIFFQRHSAVAQELHHPAGNVVTIVEIERQEALLVEGIGMTDGARTFSMKVFRRLALDEQCVRPNVQYRIHG